jgi:hypothetical protein
MPTEYVRCRVCNRVVIGKVPPGGDGSVLLPRKHKRPDRTLCTGHWFPGAIIGEIGIDTESESSRLDGHADNVAILQRNWK